MMQFLGQFMQYRQEISDAYTAFVGAVVLAGGIRVLGRA